MNLTPRCLGLVALIAVLGILGEWSVPVGAFPWWRLAAAALILAVAYEGWSARRPKISARWRGGERLRLGRLAALELELTTDAARPLSVQCACVLPVALRPGPMGTSPRPASNLRDDDAKLAPLSNLNSAVPASAASAGALAEAPSPGQSTAVLRLPAHGNARLRVEVRPVLLDAHRWPAVPVRVRGPFGLAWWSRTLATDQSCLVAPDWREARERQSGSAATGAAGQAISGAGLELDHLRPYRAGDPRHTIDWKASARTAGLITRVFSEDQHLEIVIALDAGRTSRVEIDGMNQLGHYVNLAVRFAEHCAANEDLVGLVAFADKPLAVLPPARGLAAVTGLRRALAKLACRSVESDPLEAAMRITRLVRRRCLVIILTDLYSTGDGGRLADCVRMLAARHLPVVVGLESAEVITRAGADAHDWLDPYRSLAASSYQRRMQAGLGMLVRLGAMAFTARPEELDRKVLHRYRSLRAQHRI